MTKLDELKKIKEEADSISPFFCTAKWTEATICLQNLTTHSCHHCKPHHLSTKDIRKNPDAFYNTKERKISRKEMLSGKIPKECSYCSLVEKEGAVSERFTKSSFLINPVTRKNILGAGYEKNIDPLALEIIFSSDCNLKCAYCLPQNSSSVYNDYLKHGLYYCDRGLLKNIKHYFRWLQVKRSLLEAKKKKEVKEIFNKWLKLKLTNLTDLRLTGGEPLLADDTFKLLKEFGDKKYPKLKFSVNTNLALPAAKVQHFYQQLEAVSENVHKVSVYTSIDALGQRGEFIREGLNFSLFEENVKNLLSLPKAVGLNYMITLSLLNLSSLKSVFAYILGQRKTFKKKHIGFSLSCVTFPQYLSPYLADEKQKQYFAEALIFMQENKATESNAGFSEAEILQAESICAVVGSLYKSEKMLKPFKKFIKEFSLRNKKDFCAVFPENAYLLKK